MNLELQSSIASWRQRAAEGTLTEAEMLEAVVALRQGRIGAQIASSASHAKKAKASTPPPSADDLLGELMG